MGKNSNNQIFPYQLKKHCKHLKPIRIVRYTIMNKPVHKRTDFSPGQEDIFNA